jgi:hypothetical protein
MHEPDSAANPVTIVERHAHTFIATDSGPLGVTYSHIHAIDVGEPHAHTSTGSIEYTSLTAEHGRDAGRKDTAE